jgi:hypothetical protein
MWYFNPKIGAHTGDRIKGDIDIPDRPSSDHRWDMDKNDWVIPNPSLGDWIKAVIYSGIANYADQISPVELVQIIQLQKSLEAVPDVLPEPIFASGIKPIVKATQVSEILEPLKQQILNHIDLVIGA